MKNNKKFCGIGTLISVALLMLTVGLSITTPTNADDSQTADSLYIGDGGDNSVKRFDANSGAYQGDFILPGSPGGRLIGPRGLIFTGGVLDLVNQNVNQNPNGEILQYQRDTGDFKDALVDQQFSL
jgi:hypothetical protein